MAFTDNLMLKTTRILLPSVLLSLTILGLAAIYNGGLVDVQWGVNNRFRIEGIAPTQIETES